MMEQMIANMMGISTEEMAEMAAGMQTLLRDGVTQLNKIEADTARIREILEAQYGDGKPSGNG